MRSSRGGHEVTALARSPQRAEALGAAGVRVIAGDLHDTKALQRAAEQQDVIYHVAGLVAARDEAEFMWANRDGTRNVMAAAEAVRCAPLRPGILARRSRPLAAEEHRSPAMRPPGRSPHTDAVSSRPKRLSEAAPCPGRSFGRRSYTVPATARFSRSFGWHGSAWRRCSEMALRSSPQCMQPIWPPP